MQLQVPDLPSLPLNVDGFVIMLQQGDGFRLSFHYMFNIGLQFLSEIYKRVNSYIDAMEEDVTLSLVVDPIFVFLLDDVGIGAESLTVVELNLKK